MIILNRIVLLSEYLKISTDDLLRLCQKTVTGGIKSGLKNQYRSKSTIDNLFQTHRSEGVLTLGGFDNVRDVRDANLIFDVTSVILAERGEVAEAGLRVDAKLNNFLTAVQADPDRVRQLLAESDVEVVDFFEQFCFKKSSFLPRNAIIPRSRITERENRPQRHFSIFRRSAVLPNPDSMVEEKIIINHDLGSEVEYTDFQGRTFKGIAFLSKEKIVIICFSKTSSFDVLGYCKITIFLPPLFGDEYMIAMQRSGENDARENTYRCIGLERGGNFSVNQNIIEDDIRRVRYADVLAPSTFMDVQSSASFELSVQDARGLLSDGISRHEAYRHNSEKFRDISSLRELMRRLDDIVDGNQS